MISFPFELIFVSLRFNILIALERLSWDRVIESFHLTRPRSNSVHDELALQDDAQDLQAGEVKYDRPTLDKAANSASIP